MSTSRLAPDAVPTGNTYNKYTTANPIERTIVGHFFDVLRWSLPIEAPARVLEVGVGEGEVSSMVRELFPDVELVGVDLLDPDLAASWLDRGITGVYGDIAHLPFSSQTFDLVLAVEVLEHVPDPDAGLAELHRVCRRDLVASVPREPIWRVANVLRGQYVGDLGNTPGHIQHWAKEDFARFVTRHFDLVSVRSPFPWTVISAKARGRA